jgi:aldose 1-epimerase
MKIQEITSPNIRNKAIKLYELKNAGSTSIRITNAGAAITSIETKDKNANFSNIVLGFDNPEEYLAKNYLENCTFLGATIGRFANRIAKGRFTLNGKSYTLNVNNGNNHLHGGPTGYHQKIWGSRIENTDAGQTLVMELSSPDGEEGYPGKVDVKVKFRLTNENELIINYQAKSDRPTPVNLTNHSYFNLSGKNTDILNHEVMIFADAYTPKNDDIPTGEIASIKGTPYDFKEFHKISERFSDLPYDAYDHNMVINGNEGDLRRASIAKDPESGRFLEVYTTMPGMQFYTGYHLDGTSGNSQRKFDRFAGMCFETQYFPDSPNQPDFPSCIVTPEKPLNHTTVFKFGVKD